MPYTYYLTDKLIDHSNGKAAYSEPVVYVGLSTTTPALNGTGVTEPSTGSYARVATSSATWNSAATGSTTNAASITFPTATADWAAGANLTYAVLYDASTSGNLLSYGALTAAKSCLNGDTVSISIGNLTITLS